MTIHLPTWHRRIIDATGATTEQSLTYGVTEEATVAEIMTRSTYCVLADVRADAAAALLLTHRLSGLPVVEPDGRPIGVVSKTDLLLHLHERCDGRERPSPDDAALRAVIAAGGHDPRVDTTTVLDVMMPMVFSLTPEVPITRAAALMAGEGVHRLPIVDERGAVCGILSALDIVRWVALQAGFEV